MYSCYFSIVSQIAELPVKAPEATAEVQVSEFDPA